MNEKSKSLKRLTWLTIATMLMVGLWWTTTHSDGGYMEEARRIIVYTTTS